MRTVQGYIIEGPDDLRAKRISGAFCLIFLPVLGLAMLAMFSGVRVTVQYGPGWYVAYVAVMVGLAACMWRLRERLTARFYPRGDGTPARLFGKMLIVLCGFGVLAAYAVFGGAPVVAHYVTAHPGELTVTVTGKDAHYRRSACSPRLNIREFTFFLHDHICPSSRAFAEISVGSSLRLEGEVSPFGISVKKYYWWKTFDRQAFQSAPRRGVRASQ